MYFQIIAFVKMYIFNQQTAKMTALLTVLFPLTLTVGTNGFYNNKVIQGLFSKINVRDSMLESC